jgi:hypothetical protein
LLANLPQSTRICQHKFGNILNLLIEKRGAKKVAKYETNRHYDAMEMNIDIRAESLIEIIHEKRGLLHQEVKLQRRNTELELEAIKEQNEADSQGLKAAFGNVSGVDEALSVIEKSSDQICVITFFFINHLPNTLPKILTLPNEITN